MLPAGLDQVRDLFRVVGTARQPEGDVTAEQPARRDRSQPGQPQRAPQPRAAGRGTSATPRTSRWPRYCPRHGPRRRASAARAAPTSQPPRYRGRESRDQASRDQLPGCSLIAAGQIQDARRQPGPGRGLDQHRMQRMPEPYPGSASRAFPPGSAGPHAGLRRQRHRDGSSARGGKPAACLTGLPAAGPAKPKLRPVRQAILGLTWGFTGWPGGVLATSGSAGSRCR